MDGSNIFGDLIPDLYFSKITLETSSGALGRKLTRPEIGLEDSRLLLRQKIQNKKVSAVSSAFKTQAVETEQTDGFVKITLELVAKNTITPSTTTSWFEQNNFTKFLKLVVIQAENKETQDFIQEKGLIGLGRIPPDKVSTIKFSEKILKIPEDVLGGLAVLKTQEQVYNDEGQQVQDIPFRVSFLVAGDPKDLSYYSYCFIDIGDISKEFGFTENFSRDESVYGNAIRENVITGGQINSQSFIFLGPDGNAWLGPVFDDGRGSLFGNREKTIKLQRITLDNNKIQDFRKVVRMERLLLDFSITNNLRLNSKLDKTKAQKTFFKEGKSYFTNLCLSQDQEGNVRFFFGFDARRFLQDNSIYGKIFLNAKQFEQAVIKSYIQTIRVYRKRIAGSAEAGSEPKREYLFDANRPAQPIVESKDLRGNFNNLIAVNTKKASLREVPSLYTEDTSSVGIRYFTGADKTVKDFTDGYYQYSVEVALMDGSNFIIEDKMNQLQQSKNELNSYLALASKPENFDGLLNRFTNKFSNQMIAKYGLGNSEAPWIRPASDYLDFINLTSELNELEEEELRKQLYVYCNPKTGNPNGISSTLELINNLVNKLSKSLTLSNQSTNLGHSDTTQTKQSTVAVKQSNFKALGIDKTFFEIVNTSLLTKEGYEVLDIESPDDAEGLKTITGQDYNTRVERENNTIFNINNNVKPNINLEVGAEKFTENDSIDGTSYSYLGMSYALKGGNRVLSRVGNSPGPGQSLDSFSSFAVSSKKDNSAKSPSPAGPPPAQIDTGAPTLQNNTLQILGATLSSFGVTPVQISLAPGPIIVKGTIPRFSAVRDSTPVDLAVPEFSACFNRAAFKDVVDASPILLNLIDKLSPATNARAKVGGSGGNTLIETRKDKIQTTDLKMYDLTNKVNYVREVVRQPDLVKSELFFRGTPHETTISDSLRQLPNHTKALFLETSRPEILKANWKKELGPSGIQLPGQKTKFDIFQNFIQAVEVFTGFKQDAQTKEPLIKEDSWQPLTLAKFNTIFSKTLLCRMKIYRNELVGVIPDAGLTMPVFHQYFLIISQPRPPLQVIQPPVLIDAASLPNFPNLRGLLGTLNTSGITPTTTSVGTAPGTGITGGTPTLPSAAPPPGTLVFEPDAIPEGSVPPATQQRCSNIFNEVMLNSVPIERVSSNAGGIYDTDVIGTVSTTNTRPTLAGVRRANSQGS